MIKGIKKNNNKRIVFILIGGMAVLSLFLVLLKSKNTLPNTIQQEDTISQEFQSDLLDFRISVPRGFTVEDNQISVTLKKGNEQIVLSRNGTNFQNVNDYVANFDTTRSLIVKEELKIPDSLYDNLSRVEMLKGGPVDEQKVVYLYINDWIYTLSTTSPELYDDLDQIVKSFEYIGK